jgi:hypothetical protein
MGLASEAAEGPPIQLKAFNMGVLMMRLCPTWSVCAFLLANPAAVLADHARVPLKPLAAYAKLDPTAITVSGISSGAFFAHQFHVAFSGLVKGAAMVAGGLYACAEQVEEVRPPFGNPFLSGGVPRSVVAALAVCTRFGRAGFAQSWWSFPDTPDAAASRKSALAAHAAGQIDDPTHLASSRVWLFHGDKDAGVPRTTMAEMRAFYILMGVPAANIEMKEGPDAEHGMPVKEPIPAGSGPHCRIPEESFLVRCDYGAAELLLRHLYPGSARAARAAPGHIAGFDQTQFFDKSEERMSLNETGYLYVPSSCENGAPAAVRCNLHVAFHGCQQYVGRIHDAFFRDAGYNAWADANNVIILYPQVTAWSRLTDPVGLTANPNGCWDWWGYSGDDYFTREGKQMRAVRAMIERMLP